MSVLLRAHIAHLRAAGRSPRTVSDRQHVLTAADRQLPYGIDQAATTELEEWLGRPEWGAWTRCTYYRHLVGFYRWATNPYQPRLDFDPSAALTRPRHPDADPNPVTDDEVRLAMERSDDWWQLVVALAAYGGLRASEIANLRRQDVGAEAITIAGKGNRTKQVPTHPEIWSRVEHRPAGVLLAQPSGLPYQDLPARARRHFDRIRLYEVHLHRFRHWYATSLLRNGADIITVRDLMRHTSIKATETYLAIVDGQRRLAIRTLPVLSSHQQEAA